MVSSVHPERLHLLLVEDNAADVRLIREAFRTNGQEIEVVVARDGVEALDHLRRGVMDDSPVPPPDLILLDLNLPRKSGREVLREIKADARLAAIPVVVLTTSAADEDIAFAYRTHANSYIVKPVNLDRFLEVVGSIGAYWSRNAASRGGDGIAKNAVTPRPG